MRKYYLLLALIIVASCATAQQNVTIVTSQANATIYLDNVAIDPGPQKIAKWEAHQIVVTSPGYEDAYYAIVPNHGSGFDKEIDLPASVPSVIRKEDEKYIDIQQVEIYFNNVDEDIDAITLPKKLTEGEPTEEDYADAEAKKEMADAKKGVPKASLDDENKVQDYVSDGIDTKLYTTLKNTGYVDTVNQVFSDNNNTLVLAGKITKIRSFYIFRQWYTVTVPFSKMRVSIRWYIKNAYGEILDSVDDVQMSGQFVDENTGIEDYSKKVIDKMYADAVEASYRKLHFNAVFLKYNKVEKQFTIADPELSIPSPTSVVSIKGEAADASVTVKTKDGHGSGFAISNDGYIITNYHVIAGRVIGKPNEATVITADNDTLPGVIVRYNPFRDLALIKVDKKFAFAFNCSNVKSFEKLEDVFTIGAPESLELGQSISAGIISNERNNNNNVLLQLGMSVNEGNSGGPLFNAAGVLEGVVCAKLIGQYTEGVAFAIPSYLIQSYLNIKYGR